MENAKLKWKMQLRFTAGLNFVATGERVPFALLERRYGAETTQRIVEMYHIGESDGYTIFWQVDIAGRVRAGKCMLYDETTGKRSKYAGSIDWVHSVLRRSGALPEAWELTQCLYGEHLLRERPEAVVALVEAYKTAHVGAIIMPDYVWLATDSLTGLTESRLAVLKGREVLLFPDEGKGYDEWRRRIAEIAPRVGFKYRVSAFMEGRERGADIADVLF